MIALAFMLLIAAKPVQFDINEIYTEMSMDTYKHGSNASPLVRTVGNQRPKIDSLRGDSLYGHIGKKHFIWDASGICVSGKCDVNHNLAYSNKWKF